MHEYDVLNHKGVRLSGLLAILTCTGPGHDNHAIAAHELRCKQGEIRIVDKRRLQQENWDMRINITVMEFWRALQPLKGMCSHSLLYHQRHVFYIAFIIHGRLEIRRKIVCATKCKCNIMVCSWRTTCMRLWATGASANEAEQKVVTKKCAAIPVCSPLEFFAIDILGPLQETLKSS